MITYLLISFLPIQQTTDGEISRDVREEEIREQFISFVSGDVINGGSRDQSKVPTDLNL